MRKTGRYENINGKQCFIPEALPPKNPVLALDPQATIIYGEAMLHLGKLSGVAERLPDIHRFLKAYVIKEALLSSEIEGIQTTILDVFTQPLLDSKPTKEIQLVLNYVEAVTSAVGMIHKEGLPISSRVVRKSHELLMNGEGDHSNPGQYRTQMVKVGTLIPTPPMQIHELMSELEHFINIDETIPPLIKAGLAHVQFETIHPFFDGNGRIGRLLIVLMLIQDKLLSSPILYPSYYFKKHRSEYYQHLDRVRTDGDFEGWIVFYLTGIRDSSIDAVRRIDDIEQLRKQLLKKVLDNNRVSDKQLQTRMRALQILFSFPVINIGELEQQLDVSYNTAHQIIKEFITHGILVEENEQKRYRMYKFKQYLDILEKDYK
jgi:Fic family protein